MRALALTLALTFTACDGGDDPTDSGAATTDSGDDGGGDTDDTDSTDDTDTDDTNDTDDGEDTDAEVVCDPLTPYIKRTHRHQRQSRIHGRHLR